jgi:hypothetical protein
MPTCIAFHLLFIGLFLMHRRYYLTNTTPYNWATIYIKRVLPSIWLGKTRKHFFGDFLLSFAIIFSNALAPKPNHGGYFSNGHPPSAYRAAASPKSHLPTHTGRVAMPSCHWSTHALAKGRLASVSLPVLPALPESPTVLMPKNG